MESTSWTMRARRSPRRNDGQARGRQPLEPLVDPHPQVGEQPEGGIVADQALLVAQEPTGQPEELDGHDGHRQGGLVRVLRRLRDQPGGRAQETDVRRDGARAEERRDDHAARRRTGHGQGPAHRGAPARPFPSASERITTPPQSWTGGASRTTRSLTAKREGRWAAMTTVRPTMRRRTADSTPSSVAAVEIRGGLVEEEKGRVPQERPRQGNALPLPRRQPGALGAQHGREPLGQSGHHIVEAGIANGGANFVIGGVGSAEANVVGDGAGEEVRALRDPGHPAPPRIGVEVGQIDTADGDRAARGGNQAEEDPEKGGLATAAGSGDGDHLPGLDGEGEVAESGERAVRVADLELVDPQRGGRRVGNVVTAAAVGDGWSSTSKTSSAAFIPSALAW